MNTSTITSTILVTEDMRIHVRKKTMYGHPASYHIEDSSYEEMLCYYKYGPAETPSNLEVTEFLIKDGDCFMAIVHEGTLDNSGAEVHTFTYINPRSNAEGN